MPIAIATILSIYTITATQLQFIADAASHFYSQYSKKWQAYQRKSEPIPGLFQEPYKTYIDS